MARKRKVELEWHGPYDLETTDFSDEAGMIGVYLVANVSAHYEYPYGKSHLLYVGEGDLGVRLPRHASGRGNKGIKEALDDGDGLNVFFCFVDKDDAECVEGAILSTFLDEYGEWPHGNGRAGTCRVDKQLLISGLEIIEDFDVSDD